MDGSTDSGNVEQELIFAVHFKLDDIAKEVYSQSRYLAILNPSSATSHGLLDCLKSALDRINVNIDDKETHLSSQSCPVLVGGGTDGASVNVGVHTGIKTHMQQILPWLFWSWCFSHRLELACKDACTSSLFTDINDMLLRLYYLYSNSAKKTAHLSELVQDLEATYHFPKGGSVPVFCHGTRWITHKRRAMQRIIDRFGAYITHLEAMISDSSTKQVDKAKLTGYHRKWNKAEMLLGCAMYVDVLKAPSLLSLTLQDETVEIVRGIKSILQAVTSLQALSKTDPKEWPTVKLVLSRVDSDGSCQGVSLIRFNDTTITSCSRIAKADLEKLDDTIKMRLSWSDLKLLRSILAFIDTRSWSALPASSSQNDSEDKLEIRNSLEYIVTVFREPLEAKGMCVFALIDEVDEVVDFYRKYLESQGENYRKVWYKLFRAADSKKWTNILFVAELIFSLPLTNSKVERTFSKMNVVKTERRTSLKPETLDDLMEINVEGPTLNTFSAGGQIVLVDHSKDHEKNTGKERKQKDKKKQN